MDLSDRILWQLMPEGPIHVSTAQSGHESECGLRVDPIPNEISYGFLAVYHYPICERCKERL